MPDGKPKTLDDVKTIVENGIAALNALLSLLDEVPAPWGDNDDRADAANGIDDAITSLNAYKKALDVLR
jgi:hypothetical protein